MPADPTRFRFPAAAAPARLATLAATARLVADAGGEFTGEGYRLRPPPVLPRPREGEELGAYCQRLAAPPERQLVLLVQAGEVALGLWRGDELRAHKVLSRYVVRGKGKAQPKHLRTRGKSRYGARLRLRNARRLREEVAAKLGEWAATHGAPERVFWSCPAALRKEYRETLGALVEAAEPIGLDVARPRHAELLRVRRWLEHGELQGAGPLYSGPVAAPPTVAEPARETPVLAEVDVLVCGGGPAGYCAAIAAARAGARTLLVEGSGVLGGAAVQSLVLPLMTFHASPEDQVVRGIGEELVARLVAAGGSPGHLPDPLGCAATVTPADPELLRLAILELVAEAGVELRLYTQVVGTLMEGDRVAGVLVESKSGRGALRARVTVDATGDADVAARAGAAFTHGRAADGLTQPMTMMFRLGGVDRERLREALRENPEDFVLADEARARLDELPCLAVAGFFSAVAAAQARGQLGEFRDRVLCFELPAPGEVVVNMTRVTGASGTRAEDLARATREALGQVREVLAFLRASVPGFEAARLLQTASHIGVRETRHVAGRATLTAEDVLAGRRPPDGVARGAFPIDIHSPDGAGLTMKAMAPGASYSIPYACMLPQGLGGVLVAGRAISATHEASASSRLSPTCMALGQAAGEAAAMAASQGIEPAEVDVATLRSRLEAAGAVV